MAKFLNIDEEAVQSYIRTGGPVNDLLNDVAKGVRTYSVAYITAGHVRSGRLLRGLWWNRAKLTGPLQGVARAGSSAKHTMYFHEGTGPVIGGRPHMVVPKNRRAAHTNTAFSGAGAQQLARASKRSKPQQAMGKGVMRKDTVRGQKAKPFLDIGLKVSLAKQRLK